MLALASAASGRGLVLAAYAAATGRQLRVVHRFASAEQPAMLALDPAGRRLLVYDLRPGVAWTRVDLITGQLSAVPAGGAKPPLGIAW